MRPSPSCIRSFVVKVRAGDVMTWVRSGDASPLPICRTGLEQLRRHQHVERAGHRVEAEHRPARAELGLQNREDLDVIRRRAGALRDTGIEVLCTG
jgi:hypothetical protein